MLFPANLLKQCLHDTTAWIINDHIKTVPVKIAKHATSACLIGPSHQSVMLVHHAGRNHGPSCRHVMSACHIMSACYDGMSYQHDWIALDVFRLQHMDKHNRLLWRLLSFLIANVLVRCKIQHDTLTRHDMLRWHDKVTNMPTWHADRHAIMSVCHI